MRFKTDTEAVVLAVLANGPKHGYGIAKTIRTETGGVLKLGEGQLYPLLRTMEESGWVLGEWDPEAGDQPRRIYSLSDAGRAELERRAESWQAFVHAVDRFIPAPRTLSEPDAFCALLVICGQLLCELHPLCALCVKSGLSRKAPMIAPALEACR